MGGCVDGLGILVHFGFDGVEFFCLVGDLIEEDILFVHDGG